MHALLSVRLAARLPAHRPARRVSAVRTASPTSPSAPASLVHVGPADLDLGLANLPPVGPDGLAEPVRRLGAFHLDERRPELVVLSERNEGAARPPV